MKIQTWWSLSFEEKSKLLRVSMNWHRVATKILGVQKTVKRPWMAFSWGADITTNFLRFLSKYCKHHKLIDFREMKNVLGDELKPMLMYSAALSYVKAPLPLLLSAAVNLPAQRRRQPPHTFIHLDISAHFYPQLSAIPRLSKCPEHTNTRSIPQTRPHDRGCASGT